MTLKETYMSSTLVPRLPDSIQSTDLLVGWSMEQKHQASPIGFKFGDQDTAGQDDLVDPILFGDEGHGRGQRHWLHYPGSVDLYGPDDSH